MISVEKGSPAVVLKLSSGSGIFTGITSIDMLKYMYDSLGWHVINMVINQREDSQIPELYNDKFKVFIHTDFVGYWLLVVPEKYVK